MPSTFNGIGTTIVKASRATVVDDEPQFDAIEAFVFVNLPIIPYRVVHVLSMRESGRGEQYRYFELRRSMRIIVKGVLNGWANMLLFMTIFAIPIVALAHYNMEREVSSLDYYVWWFLIGGLVVGVLFKILMMALDAKDYRIKKIIGPHQHGTSDPFTWVDVMANQERAKALETASANKLVDVARSALARDDRSAAMFFARLAQRTGEKGEASEIVKSILTDGK